MRCTSTIAYLASCGNGTGGAGAAGFGAAGCAAGGVVAGGCVCGFGGVVVCAKVGAASATVSIAARIDNFTTLI